MSETDSQEKPVTWNTVKRLFNGIDIAYMHMIGYPLDDYEFVKRNANALLGRIKSEVNPMPPEPFLPWTQDKIDTFEAWIAGDYKEREDDISERLRNFIGLSEFLTGFNDLSDDPNLAEIYLEQLEANETDPNHAIDPDSTPIIITVKDLNAAIDAFGAASSPADFDPNSLPEATKNACKTIIHLWYTATIMNDFGFPIKETFVTETTNQWRRGLAWRAAETHPMGYATDGYFDEKGKEFIKFSKEGGLPYWHFPPENGKRTGLANPPQNS